MFEIYVSNMPRVKLIFETASSYFGAAWKRCMCVKLSTKFTILKLIPRSCWAIIIIVKLPRDGGRNTIPRCKPPSVSGIPPFLCVTLYKVPKPDAQIKSSITFFKTYWIKIITFDNCWKYISNIHNIIRITYKTTKVHV